MPALIGTNCPVAASITHPAPLAIFSAPLAIIGPATRPPVSNAPPSTTFPIPRITVCPGVSLGTLPKYKSARCVASLPKPYPIAEPATVPKGLAGVPKSPPPIAPPISSTGPPYLRAVCAALYKPGFFLPQSGIVFSGSTFFRLSVGNASARKRLISFASALAPSTSPAASALKSAAFNFSMSAILFILF